MATNEKASLPHIERTVNEPRENKLHPVILSKISQVNSSIRLLRLTPVEKEPIKFDPGQWVDLHIPKLPSPGGFTLTSTPSLSPSYLELAIQRPPSPARPRTHTPTPAHWLFQPPSQILNTTLSIRTGGSFIWPPPAPSLPRSAIKRVVFTAGGVGINPLMSMVSVIAEERKRESIGAGSDKPRFRVVFLYSVRRSRDPNGAREKILFLDRLRGIFEGLGQEGEFRLFLTGEEDGEPDPDFEGLKVQRRRIDESDLEGVLGEKGERDGTVVYVCGVPAMTDRFVQSASKAEGMDERRVLSEKWW